MQFIANARWYHHVYCIIHWLYNGLIFSHIEPDMGNDVEHVFVRSKLKKNLVENSTWKVAFLLAIEKEKKTSKNDFRHSNGGMCPGKGHGRGTGQADKRDQSGHVQGRKLTLSKKRHWRRELVLRNSRKLTCLSFSFQKFTSGLKVASSVLPGNPVTREYDSGTWALGSVVCRWDFRATEFESTTN